MSDQDKLQGIRERIDSLDVQIQELINQRAAAAQEVARIKLAEDKDAFFYRPDREATVLRTIKERNKGPMGDEDMARLFREVMSACLALEQPMKIAFLGPEGTFTQAAALKHFGHSVNTIAMGSISDIFREVESGMAHYGVVPVENSTEGVINHTLDTFINSPLQICGEVMLRIHHHLLSMAPDLKSVKRVYSHQQSLAQCRLWLDRNLPHAEQITVGSNAEAAKMAKEEHDAAAIAGEMAAEIYQLKGLATNIEDEPDNTTRFLVIARQKALATGEDKTTLLCATRNVAGGLSSLLTPLADHNISMSRIESRPSRKGNWDYVFFIDIEGHQDDPNVKAALDDFEKQARMLKVLGSYPNAVL
ncbi:prephenate dehydratase [Solemya velesiana gill symbiont]|uniref:Bifunctional chorismate mutase/prephenate dehydratase n=1 Tax=Solemya velesiana gill symbiont TaxID=1918948 RepID=A0A1T2KU22_9GAMM|nr:prephenate dehydratase [Solemya velesiana gill symbiont]OOZ36345.1 chorismate mutase [Solemya velesiana gill symbiont]